MIRHPDSGQYGPVPACTVTAHQSQQYHPIYSARTRLHGDGAIAALEGKAFLQRLPHGGGEGTAS